MSDDRDTTIIDTFTDMRDAMACPYCESYMWVSLVDGSGDGEEIWITWSCGSCGGCIQEYYERTETQ